MAKKEAEYTNSGYHLVKTDLKELDSKTNGSGIGEPILLSISLSERELNFDSFYKILRTLELSRSNSKNIGLSRPLPKCMLPAESKKITKLHDIPENCAECKELSQVVGEHLILCPNVFSITGPRLGDGLLHKRQEIYKLFRILHDMLDVPQVCGECTFWVRGDCDGLCFRHKRITTSELIFNLNPTNVVESGKDSKTFWYWAVSPVDDIASIICHNPNYAQHIMVDKDNTIPLTRGGIVTGSIELNMKPLIGVGEVEYLFHMRLWNSGRKSNKVRVTVKND